jgi:hypothetical protein
MSAFAPINLSSHRGEKELIAYRMAGFEILKVGIVQTSEALVVFIHTTNSSGTLNRRSTWEGFKDWLKHLLHCE